MSDSLTIKLGVAPIAWSNSDLPELGGETSLEQCLAESRQAGYIGVESGIKFPMDPNILAPDLQRFGLQLVSGWFSGELLGGDVNREIDRVQTQLDTFLALGAPVLIYGETFGSVQTKRDVPIRNRPRLKPQDWPAYGKRLTQFADALAVRGMPVSFHPHMGTAVENDRDIENLMEHTGDSVGLLLDTGHITYAGGDIQKIIDVHHTRINHVHFKDVRADVLDTARKENMSFLDSVLAGVFTVPGDGMISFINVVAELHKHGYQGWGVVEAEQDPVMAPPFEYAQLGYRYLHKILRAAGYEITA
ncbi:MAG: myo-inosose-2 dehydratase [Pseudomonadota bacterium]